MKRNDLILLGSIVLLTMIIFAAYFLYPRKNGDAVVISVDGTVIKTLPLNQDTTYKIKSADNGVNTLVIQSGSASVTNATCPDKLCVHQKNISKKGETIVCLPHKVVISIESSKSSTLDAIAN